MRRRRGLRYKGVPVSDNMVTLTGALFVLMILGALVSWLVDLLRAWLP